MIVEDDVALEVFWVFYVISFIVGGMGQFVRVVDPVVSLSEVAAELLVFFGRLLRIRDAPLG